MNHKTTLTLMLGVGLGVGAALTPRLWSPDVQAAADTPPAALTFDPRVSLAPLVEQLAPSVVHIKVQQQVAVPEASMYHLFGPFSGLPGAEGQEGGQGQRFRTRQGEGSGFVLSEDGLILTNNHVVDDADTVTVTLSDDRTFEAKVLGTDPRTDVALVQIDADVDLTPAKLGSSDAMRVGDQVVAIGNPFGLDHSVSAGILSGKGRRIGAGPYDAFLQTDASINPGNSGGPLFNLKGEVVGINTAIIGQGIGFAIPIDMAKDIVDELQQDGHVSRGWIGVSLAPLSPELAAQLRVDEAAGFVIGEVHPDTPAAKADLKRGDVVLSLDGEPVGEVADFIRAIGSLKPGHTVRLGIIRGGEQQTIKLKLGERPEAL